MKKIFLLLFSVMVGVNCLGQQHISDFVAFNLPEGSYKTNSKQLNAATNSADAISDNLGPPYIYQVKNTFFGFYKVKQNANKDELQTTKRFMDELYSLSKKHGNNTYVSSIKTVNNKQVLIVYHKRHGICYYGFYCENETNSLTLPAILQFNEKDAAEGEKILDELLQDIKFTK